jgi:hypothetical protein
MPTPEIARLIARIPVRPTLLFQNDIDSTDGHDDDTAAVEATLAAQGPEDSGEVEHPAPNLGLMSREGYVDMRKPWVEGPRSEKVSRNELSLANLADVVLVYSAADGLSPHRPANIHRIPKFEKGRRLGCMGPRSYH